MWKLRRASRMNEVGLELALLSHPDVRLWDSFSRQVHLWKNDYSVFLR